MANGKYAKYVNEFKGAGDEIKHDSHYGNITHPPLMFDSRHLAESHLHLEAWVVYAAGDGFGIGYPLEAWPQCMPGAKPVKVTRDLPMRHPYDEAFLYLGTDPKDNTDLGGEVEYWLGEGDDAEKYTITKSSVVYVPAGLVHCPIYMRKVDRPFLSLVILLAPEWSGQFVELPKAFKADIPHPQGLKW
jgi:hypothetical protein